MGPVAVTLGNVSTRKLPGASLLVCVLTSLLSLGGCRRGAGTTSTRPSSYRPRSAPRRARWWQKQPARSPPPRPTRQLTCSAAISTSSSFHPTVEGQACVGHSPDRGAEAAHCAATVGVGVSSLGKLARIRIRRFRLSPPQRRRWRDAAWAAVAWAPVAPVAVARVAALALAAMAPEAEGDRRLEMAGRPARARAMARS